MALHKMNSSQIDLKSDRDGDSEDKTITDLGASDHKKRFTEKIEKIVGEKSASELMAERMETKERTARRESAAKRPASREEDADSGDRAVTDLRHIPAHSEPPGIENHESSGSALSSAEVPDTEARATLADIERAEREAATSSFEPAEIKKKYRRLEFPRGFLWGTSTSAYQTEGGIENDWSQWEKSSKRLRQLMKKQKPSHEYICNRACDSYHRFAEDFDLAKALNNNAIRFGLEWARIQPKKDTIDVDALNHYREVLREAKKRGLVTVVTLWHWTNPLWLARTGGWENKRAVKYFSDYVDLVVRELGANIDYWVTINEPNMYVFGAYLHRQFPPQKFSPLLAAKAFLNLTRAHNRAYRVIHRHFPRARVGFTGLFNYIEPANRFNPIGLALSAITHYLWNGWMLARTKTKFDFIGLNYYFHDRLVSYPPFRQNQNEWVNDKGWEIYPKGIYCMLKYLSKFGKPILVTENGVADAEDRHRARFIERHLYWTHKAISEGVDVRGYFHWSLIDNFEWADGWLPKFGLYEMDRKTFARQARPSAGVYADICKKNRVKINT